MIIYKAVNKINCKIYIGQTVKTLNERMYGHLFSKEPFGRALSKYGLESFEFSIIDSCLLREISNEKEKYWIGFYNCKVPNGYNVTIGGEGQSGLIPSEETKRKIGQANKGRIRTQETRMKMSKIGKGKKHILKKKRLGKIWSIESREKLRKSQIGKKHSEETKKKMSLIMMGKRVGENNPSWKGGHSRNYKYGKYYKKASHSM